MSITALVQVVSVVFLGLAGLWLAHNYRRQVRIKLADRQVDAYQQLWNLTAVANPERSAPLDHDERKNLYDAMVRWYFADGHGIFASPATRHLSVAMRTNLVCPIAEIRPQSLATDLLALPEDDAERRRGCVNIRQASLLRMQLKTDLSLHFGFRYYSRLRADDRDFLRACGLSPRRRPWRARFRTSARRMAPNPCVCGLCPPE